MVGELYNVFEILLVGILYNEFNNNDDDDDDETIDYDDNELLVYEFNNKDNELLVYKFYNEDNAINIYYGLYYED